MKPILSRLFAPLLLTLAGAAAQAADAAGEPRCQYVAIAKLPLHYTGPSLQLTTDGVIDGTPAVMLVDTGAYDTFLTRTGTERRNMPLRNTGSVAYGVGGFSSIYQTRVTEFKAGPAKSAKGYLRVLTDFGFTPSFDAILGAPFLLQADLEISLATKELTFFRPINCDGRHLGYWADDVLSVPFESYSGGRANPHFIVHVNGKEMEAMIDSGAQTSSISLKAAKRAGLQLDAPGVTAATNAVGVGDGKAARWHTIFKTFRMGEETIANADVAVIDHDSSVDVILGADFLRAHRVLFAMSQRKIYFSYVGGEPFGQWRKLEPWMQAEADAGNPDAQMMVSNIYREGTKVPRNLDLANRWLEKAALGGSPHANIASGRQLLLRGEVAEAAARLRAGLDQLPANRTAALWLYLARVRGAQHELARTELGTAFARSEDDEWPAPIAAFYLGKIDDTALLKQAAGDKKNAAKRRCQALASMQEWQRAHGNQDRAEALDAQGRQECRPVQPVSGSQAVQSENETG